MACPEEGCIQHDLHADTTNPGVFMLYENWQIREP
ncbi:antibiotic biosynthesis monooxygenase [uncultured Ruegeria sp.]